MRTNAKTTKAARTESPHDLSLSAIVKGKRRAWRLGDLLLLKALFHAQRRLELLQRRPDAPLRRAADMLRGAAASLASWRSGAADVGAWYDAIASDITLRPASRTAVETRLRAWLAAHRSVRRGEGIAMIIPTLGAGGAEGQLARLAARLVKEGVPVTVFVKHAGEPRFDFHREALIRAGARITCITEYIGGDGPSDLPPLDADLHRLTRSLIDAFEATRPAAVHCWMDEMGAAGGLAAAAAGVPRIVIDWRNLNPLWFETRGLGSIRAAFRALSERADFVNNSVAGAADYRVWLGLPNLNVSVVRNGFDLGSLLENPFAAAAVRARFAAPGLRLIGGMMRFAAEKRPLLWIEAAAAYARRRPDVRFVLWGEGKMRPHMLRRAAALGLSEKLAMPGLTAERGAALGALDALLLASVAEGTPNVALEAQSLGVPVVTSAAGGAGEAICPALADLVVREPSAEALAAALVRAENWDRERTRDAARSWVLEMFSPETQLADYRALYGL